MTGSNDTICTIDIENETHAATQYEEIVEMPPGNANSKTEKNGEPDSANVESIVAKSTNQKDLKIDIIRLWLSKSTIEKYIVHRFLFINLLENNDKKQINNPPKDFQIQKRNTMWVQFALFKSGGVSGSSGETGTGDSSSTSDATDSSSITIDYSINYEPGKKNHYVFMVLSLTTFVWFLNSLFLFVILNSEYLSGVFKEPGVIVTSLEFGMLLRCYFWFICIPRPRSFLLSFIPLFLTLFTVIGLAAMISVRYQTELILNACLITLLISAFLLLLSVTRFNLRSTLLYLHGIILTFVLAMTFIILTSYIRRTPYKTEHMLMLVSGSLIQTVALIMELQGIVNGTSIAELDKRDYVLAAFLMYTSIVTFFIETAKFIGLYRAVIK